MARTKRNAMLIEEARTKIRTTQLINRLQNHALGTLEPPMDMTQIRATEALLRKAVPDLSAVTMEVGGLDKLFQALGAAQLGTLEAMLQSVADSGADDAGQGEGTPAIH